MATLTINDNPSTSDTVVFTLLTPDANGCFTSNPYKVDKVIIYYVERDYAGGNRNEYENKTYDTTKLKAAEEAEAIACTTPTDDNIAAAKRLRNEAESSVTSSKFFYTEAKPVQIVGNEETPAWIFTDLENSLVEQVLDKYGNAVNGNFTYTWNPKGVREGDYFICWTWTPLPAGDSLSSHMKFMLAGDTQVTTSIPTHFTNPKKYPTLLERYTPEIFKMIMTSDDRSPDVLDKFNGAVALGFNTLEDLTNQIVDLQDSNSIHESLIPYLSNLFNLKLKTADPTRWRGQVKRAIPLFKKKGTKSGLAEAMEHASIKLIGLTQLWQIISSYTWQEVFKYEGGDPIFVLEKTAEPIDFDNFELWLRPEESSDWISLSSDYIEFITVDGVTSMYWTGSNLSIDPIDLVTGDEIRVLYKYAEIPDLTAQTIENYIRSLPLIDLRDERDQIYPVKNWNVRGIAENDAMFDVVIPNRHPFHDPLVFGKVRTEFPYSENIYNMEEYNGSIRNSKDPCDIDRAFVDPCTACLSSSYNIDLEVENLSDDRIKEALEVLKEHTPFHSVLHTVNFLGGVSEFVQSPVEDIEMLVSYNVSDFVIAGEAQTWFNRIIKLVESNGILRDELADSTVVATTSGTAYNDDIVVYCPTTRLADVSMELDGTAELHILAPSPLAGTYTLSSPSGNVAVVSPVPGSEPIDNCNNIFDGDYISNCAFAFDINNTVIDGESLCNVDQDNVCTLSDSELNFGALGVQSEFDVSQGTALASWKVLITAFDATPYDIQDIRPDGSLVLVDHGSTLPLSGSSPISYSIKNGSTVVATSTSGVYSVESRGRVTVLNSNYCPIDEIVRLRNNFFFKYSGTEYEITGFVPETDDQFYVKDYTTGSLASVNLKINQKVVAQEIGYLNYRGLKLQLNGDYETSLGIQNGANNLVVVDEGVENDKFKENFIVAIGSDNYFISDIDGNSPAGKTTIVLSGTDHYWKKLSSGGTSVSVTIYNYTKNGATIDGQQFDLPPHTFRTIDRSGRSVIDRIDENGIVTGLSLPEPEGNEINEFVYQTEGISFSIEYSDGTTEQGEL
mgnify:CR=1 FL=1